MLCGVRVSTYYLARFLCPPSLTVKQGLLLILSPSLCPTQKLITSPPSSHFLLRSPLVIAVGSMGERERERERLWGEGGDFLNSPLGELGENGPTTTTTTLPRLTLLVFLCLAKLLSRHKISSYLH